MSTINVSGGEYYGATSFGHSQNNNYNFQHQTINDCQNEQQLQIQCPSDTNTENKLNNTNGKYNLTGGVFHGPLIVGDGNTVNHIHIHSNDPDTIIHIDTNTNDKPSNKKRKSSECNDIDCVNNNICESMIKLNRLNVDKEMYSKNDEKKKK
eukprot:530834_1